MQPQRVATMPRYNQTKKAGMKPAFSVVRLLKAKISISRSQAHPSGS